MERLILRWWLHACIELEYAGKRLMIDPHDGASLGVGLSPPPREPDYVLVTHEHYDHNAVEAVAGENTVVLREHVGDFELGPYRVRGVKLPHDEYNGRIRGWVVAYHVKAGEISVVHLSDLGRPLTSDEAEMLGNSDIVFAPAGGVYTLHPRQALEVAEALNAKVLVPIHYWLPGIQLPLDPLDTILRYAKKWRVVRLESNELVVSRNDIPDEKTIVVFAPPKR